MGKIPCRKKWQPTPVFLPGESHGQRSLEGYSPWCCKELDMTDRLMLSFILKFIGKKGQFLHIYLHILSPTSILPRKRKWQPTPVFLPGESHGRRSLVGCSLQGRKESDRTERLHFHFHLELSRPLWLCHFTC